jgi:hypothetical protein
MGGDAGGHGKSRYGSAADGSRWTGVASVLTSGVWRAQELRCCSSACELSDPGNLIAATDTVNLPPDNERVSISKRLIQTFGEKGLHLARSFLAGAKYPRPRSFSQNAR